MESGSPFRFLIVGHGEISRLAHLPELLLREDALVAGLVDVTFCEKDLHDGLTAQSNSSPPKFASIEDAFRYARGEVHAVSVCTPKSATLSVARDVLRIAASYGSESRLVGILLEKPPGEDAEDLERTAYLGRSHGISMFTACHTTACAARNVIDSWLFSDAFDATNVWAKRGKLVPETIDSAICRRRLDSIRITWKENVKKWHPGQRWISKACGGGVMDMLFNPLSLIVSLFSLSLLPSLGSGSEEYDDSSRTVRLEKADLVRPCNWEAPISGHAELLMTIPWNNNGLVYRANVSIVADFAFDHELPPSDDCDGEEEIWNIEFIQVPERNGSDCSNLTVKDGGAQIYIGARRMNMEPTAEYPLRPEYQALYDQFIDLLRKNNSKAAGDHAPSIIDCTTLAVLNEIIRLGNYTVGPRYDF